MLKRISNIVRGFLGLFISNIERKNPEALLEVEKENLRKQIAKYNQGLAAHAGLCERLRNQIKRHEKEALELKAKTEAHLRAGNREQAGQYALQHQTTTKELAEKQEQLNENERVYKELLKSRDVSIKAAKDKLEALKSGIDKLKIKRASAELTEMATGMVATLGGSGDNMERLQSMVEEEGEKASGRARLAQDSINGGDADLKELEGKVMADLALADFAAAQGIALPEADGGTPRVKAPAQAKTMGPQRDTE